MKKELGLPQQLVLALSSGPNYPQLERLIEAYEMLKWMVETDVARSVGAATDDVKYARLKKHVSAFIAEINEANGR